MFGTNGFVKVSDRNWGRPAASESLRKIKSDPILPKISESHLARSNSARNVSVVDTDAGSSLQQNSSALAKRGTVVRHRNSVLPPAKVEEVTSAALASIEDIRSSMEHFQGRSTLEQAAASEEPRDDQEDLRYRLAKYRYTRRIEPPPPPLAMDPAFDPAPPRPVQVAVPVMSATYLRGFLPQRRRVQLAEQAEHRRLRLEAAKTKRELQSEELEEKTLADMDRYLHRMEQFELERHATRPGGGRRRSLASLTLEQALQERQRQLAKIMAAAAFCRAAAKALAGFGPISQACLARFKRISHEHCGEEAKPFACTAALNVWRSHYASTVQAQRKRVLPGTKEASPTSDASLSPKSPSRKSIKESPDARALQMQMPLLQPDEALAFMWRCRLMEDTVVNRVRLRRARGHAHCLFVALNCWHPFRALRMMRDVLARVKKLQRFLRSALLRLKAARVALKAQMLQMERELVEKEQEEELKEVKQESKPDVWRRVPSMNKVQDQVTRALLPDGWRMQVVHSMLRHRRHEQLQQLQVWRLDMITYAWEVDEWRKARTTLPCPKMPPYPTHMPTIKELQKIILDARQAGKAGGVLPVSFSAEKKVQESTSLDWYPIASNAQVALQEDVMEEVIEPLVTPKGSVLGPSGS